jgi:hypothetical protein
MDVVNAAGHCRLANIAAWPAFARDEFSSRFPRKFLRFLRYGWEDLSIFGDKSKGRVGPLRAIDRDESTTCDSGFHVSAFQLCLNAEQSWKRFGPYVCHIPTVLRQRWRTVLRKLALLTIFLIAFASARADQLITNGGFESGNLTGWAATSTGDGGFTVTSGTTTPLTGNATVGPHSGTYYAVSDDFSGSQIQTLTQTFTTPTSFQTATLSFAMFVNDVYGGDFGSAGPGGQVTLLNSVGTALAVLYGPLDTFENPVGSPNPYVLFSQDIASLLSANTTYELQFSSTDTSGPLNVGVDDVSLVTTVSAVPEPASFSLSALGGVLAIWRAYRKPKADEA